MVAGQHYPACPAYGYPAGRLKGLCRLVYKERGELLPHHYLVCCTNERTCHHTRLAEEVSVDTHLYLLRTLP